MHPAALVFGFTQLLAGPTRRGGSAGSSTGHRDRNEHDKDPLVKH
jgi:hypothetical protein